jgi:hypothetical protein
MMELATAALKYFGRIAAGFGERAKNMALLWDQHRSLPKRQGLHPARKRSLPVETVALASRSGHPHHPARQPRFSLLTIQIDS